VVDRDGLRNCRQWRGWRGVVAEGWRSCGGSKKGVTTVEGKDDMASVEGGREQRGGGILSGRERD
jgi:hypothetical protein